MLKLSSKYLERRRQNGAASPSQCACVCTLTLPAIPAKVERPLTDFLHVCVFHFTCVCVYACALPYLVGQPASECLPVCLSEREREGVCVCGGYYAPWMLPRALNSCLQAQVVRAGF